MKQVLLLLAAALALSACEDLDYYDYGPSSPYYGSDAYGGPYGGYHHHHRYRDYDRGYGGYYGPYDWR